MSYRLRRDRLYMMPTHFGPHSGPRQTPDGGRFVHGPPQRQRRYGVDFLTTTEAVEALLPEGFVLDGEPVVSVEMAELRDVAWLAGRGYNVLGVRVRARFEGQRDKASGPFLLVLWENRPEPIITGREQLGYNKIYAEIPDARSLEDRVECRGLWDGFEFVTMKLSGLEEMTEAEACEAAADKPGDGLLHYKYIPHTGGDWTGADAAYPTLAPWDWKTPDVALQAAPTPRVWKGRGEVAFHAPRWEDMPTQHHIVCALAALEVREFRGASKVCLYDSNDYRAQRILL